MKKLRIFIGWDEREAITYELAKYTILKHTSLPTRIIPLELGNGRLGRILTRPVEWRVNDIGTKQLWCPISNAPMSTEFAISRFSIPFLQDHGWALFMDCDMVCLDDIAKLFEHADNKYAIMVVKHKHEPTEKYHDAGQLQTLYARKNWSSVMLWNLDHPGHKNLTVEKLNTWPGRDLHAFKWLKDEEIGELSQEWNYLVEVNEPEDLRKQKMLHYTNGQPGWKDWMSKDTDYVFNEELARMFKERSSFYSEYLQRVGIRDIELIN